MSNIVEVVSVIEYMFSEHPCLKTVFLDNRVTCNSQSAWRTNKSIS